MTRNARRLRRQQGYSLVLTAFGISLAVTLLAVFIPTFLREVRLSHTAEAAEMLQQMHLGAAAYYATPQLVEGQQQTHCLPAHAGPAPREPRQNARAYDFFDDDTPDHDTWRVLTFRSERSVRYSYVFSPVQAGCDLRAPNGTFLVTYRAQGDLDGDGVQSLFERRDTSEGGALVPIGIYFERDRVE